MATKHLPIVTIAILNYQRRETLRQAIQSALRQDYPHLEVLVVDNASTDGSVKMVTETFPDIRLIPLPENIGCAARNQGVAAATGEIVVTIDNDVLFTTPHDIRRIVERFTRYPTVGCINFKILDAEGNLSTRDWCHPRDWQTSADKEFFTTYVLEGASAVRRRAFEHIGGYWAPLFLGHEGHDLAYRFLGAGIELLYTPQVQVKHLVASTARPASRIYYTYTRNAFWVSLRNHRPLPAIRAMMKDTALMGFSALRAGHTRSYLQGLWDGLCGFPQALASRQPLDTAAYGKLRQLRRLEPNVLAKIKRHWHERPI